MYVTDYPQYECQSQNKYLMILGWFLFIFWAIIVPAIIFLKLKEKFNYMNKS